MKVTDKSKKAIPGVSQPAAASNKAVKKDSISKPAAPAPKNAVSGGKKANVIDDLFSKLKEKKDTAPVKTPEPKKVNGKKPKNIDEDLGLNGGGRRYTEEGFPIYTEEELKIGGFSVHACV